MRRGNNFIFLHLLHYILKLNIFYVTTTVLFHHYYLLITYSCFNSQVVRGFPQTTILKTKLNLFSCVFLQYWQRVLRESSSRIARVYMRFIHYPLTTPLSTACIICFKAHVACLFRKKTYNVSFCIYTNLKALN